MAAAGETILLARETGQPRWAVAAQLAQATIAAERGDFDAAESLAREAEALLLPEGTTPMLALVQFVRGRGAVAHQRYAEGFEQLRRMLEPADPAFHPFVGAWALADLVEAAAHIGKKDSAMAYLDQLESLAAATSGSLLRAEAGYARAIVAQDDDAEAPYKTALEHDPPAASRRIPGAAAGGAGRLRCACLPQTGRERSAGTPRFRRKEPPSNT